MLSAVKMDLYRMRKTRSFWGVLIAMILFTVWSVAMTKMDTELPDTAQTQEAEEQTEDELFIGIGVTVEDTCRILICRTENSSSEEMSWRSEGRSRMC